MAEEYLDWWLGKRPLPPVSAEFCYDVGFSSWSPTRSPEKICLEPTVHSVLGGEDWAVIFVSGIDPITGLQHRFAFELTIASGQVSRLFAVVSAGCVPPDPLGAPE